MLFNLSFQTHCAIKAVSWEKTNLLQKNELFWNTGVTAPVLYLSDILRVFFSVLPGEDDEDSNLLILSYPQYCRYRSMLKRIQDKPSSILTDQFVLALGGIAVTSKNPQIFYCRDTFDHPTLIENESICDEFGKSHYSYFLFLTRHFSSFQYPLISKGNMWFFWSEPWILFMIEMISTKYALSPLRLKACGHWWSQYCNLSSQSKIMLQGGV